MTNSVIICVYCQRDITRNVWFKVEEYINVYICYTCCRMQLFLHNLPLSLVDEDLFFL